ncbi:MAG: CpaF family protein, partial [Bdellovibrionales bacterium]|nr:CpaF family protein [Bdellovibrionales bacterium]
DSKISLKAIQHQISSAVDIVVQVSRFNDGSRRIASISEVKGMNPDGSYGVNRIYDIGHLQRGTDGKLQGFLKPTGHVPSFIEEIESNGIKFPRNKFDILQAS